MVHPPKWGGVHINRIAVTGSNGFIGKNLIEVLSDLDGMVIRCFDLNSTANLEDIVQGVDIIYHLAGVNRPQNESEFTEINTGLTRELVDILEDHGHKPTIILSSSTQVELDNPYGRSKKEAEKVLIDYQRKTGAPIYIYRLPGVFGKWSRPNYNTVVATFCYNISHGLDISISDPNRTVTLVYVKDVVSAFLSHLSNDSVALDKYYYNVQPEFTVTLGEMADMIYGFRRDLEEGKQASLSNLFSRYLYQTYEYFTGLD